MNHRSFTDTKIFGKVVTQEDATPLQEDLNKLHGWSHDWQMLFNAEKCKCLHIGHGNISQTYKLGEHGIRN